MYDFDVLRVSALDEERPSETLALGSTALSAPLSDMPRGAVPSLPPEATVAAAIKVMQRGARPAVVVVRNQRPLGVVTPADVAAHACSQIDDLQELPLVAVMTACAAPLKTTDTVGEAFRRMCTLRQWHLPLVSAEGLIAGSLDITDLCLWIRDRMTVNDRHGDPARAPSPPR
jgi:CBS domain-containing protein